MYLPARWIERLLFLVAVVCLGTYAYAYFDARYAEYSEGRRLDRAIQERRQGAVSASPASETDSFSSFQPAQPPNPSAPPVLRLEEGTVIGRLEIPRIGVSTLVREGVGSRTLRRGAGHIPGTDLPPYGGNIGIAGHRDTFFRALKDVHAHDVVELETPEGTFHYSVDWTKVVTPGDTTVLDDPGAPSLTLVTCYPFYYVGSAPKRFIVRAHRMDAGNAAAP